MGFRRFASECPLHNTPESLIHILKLTKFKHHESIIGSARIVGHSRSDRSPRGNQYLDPAVSRSSVLSPPRVEIHNNKTGRLSHLRPFSPLKVSGRTLHRASLNIEVLRFMLPSMHILSGCVLLRIFPGHKHAIIR